MTTPLLGPASGTTTPHGAPSGPTHAGGPRVLAHGRDSGLPDVDALAAEVAAVDGREAIILTRPHVVAEFFHLDWTSQARRKLGVPVLHLLEHETIAEQAAGGGEGNTGL